MCFGSSKPAGIGEKYYYHEEIIPVRPVHHHHAGGGGGHHHHHHHSVSPRSSYHSVRHGHHHHGHHHHGHHGHHSPRASVTSYRSAGPIVYDYARTSQTRYV